MRTLEAAEEEEEVVIADLEDSTAVNFFKKLEFRFDRTGKIV